MSEIFWSNIINICLVLVGLLAFVVYVLQERRKKIEAASLIVSQIDEMQNSISEISAFSDIGNIDGISFYESLPIYKEDYWNKYKHYFVREMDSASYNYLNQFYQYVSEIQEQQFLIKNLLNNHFFCNQNTLANLETQFFLEGIHKNNYDSSQFWNDYKMQQQYIIDFIGKNGYREYTPVQTTTTLKKILTKCALNPVIGTEGYALLKKYSKKHF